jgi:hypothetical protein
MVHLEGCVFTGKNILGAKEKWILLVTISYGGARSKKVVNFVGDDKLWWC